MDMYLVFNSSILSNASDVPPENTQRKKQNIRANQYEIFEVSQNKHVLLKHYLAINEIDVLIGSESHLSL